MATHGTFKTGLDQVVGFTISWGMTNLAGEGPHWSYQIEYDTPDQSVYTCEMYQAPNQDIAGQDNFISSLALALQAESNLPQYQNNPAIVPPPRLTLLATAFVLASNLVAQGGIMLSCLWGGEFGPNTNLVTFLDPNDNSYSADITGSTGAVVGHLTGLSDGSGLETDIAVYREQPGGAPDATVTTDSSGERTLDFSHDQLPVYLSAAPPDAGPDPEEALYKDRAFSSKTGFSFEDFTTLILGNGNNKVKLYTADAPNLAKPKPLSRCWAAISRIVLGTPSPTIY